MGDALLVYGAAYDDVGEAMKDFADIKAMWGDKEIGDYDGAILTKEPSGMLILTNADSSGRFKSTFKGLFVGAVLGVVFPPSVLGMAALGAGAGAITGKAKRHLDRTDFKSLGDLLEPGESGILLVTTRVSDWAAPKVLSRAKRHKSIEVEGDAEAIIAAVRAEAEGSGGGAG